MYNAHLQCRTCAFVLRLAIFVDTASLTGHADPISVCLTQHTDSTFLETTCLSL